MECPVCGQMNADDASVCLSCSQRLPSYLGGVSIDTSRAEDKTPMVIAGNIDFPLPPGKTPAPAQPASPPPPKSEKPASLRFPKPSLPKIGIGKATTPAEEAPSQTDAFDEDDPFPTKPPSRPSASLSSGSPSPFSPIAPPPPPVDPLPMVAPMSRPAHMIYAGFWYRFLAWLIDIVILGIVLGALGTVVMVVSAAFAVRGSDFSASSLALIFGAYGLVVFMNVVASLLYFALSESSRWQATLGKLAIGLKVTDAYGKRLSFLRALARFVSHIVSNLTFGIGYVLNVFTARQQTLHDLIAGTLVVYKEVTPTDLIDNQEVPARASQKVSVMLVWMMSVMLVLTVFVVARSLVGMPAHQASGVSVRIHEAEMLGAEATAAVSFYQEKHGRFPLTLEAADFYQTSPQVRRVWIDADSGVIRLELAFAPLRKKTLEFVPEIDDEGDLIWVCRSSDIDPKHLPEHCR
ncbi:MAG: RDD family protein [Proteobacteria bacterium]|nr:RDD family protein [Pseudomonadota bacterium]MCL2307423.1 RDD family protein [Pseudomonadota bacterium]